MTLEPLPPAPDGVKYALTVPQSVLFADISLQGSREQTFKQVFGTAFALDYVAIDDGAMSWDYRGHRDFALRLCGGAEPAYVVRRFISAMGETARAVERISRVLASPHNRRAGAIDDLMVDLGEYWDAYERHMTSLFTFWNIEDFLCNALTQALNDEGVPPDAHAGLQRFLQPSETNYFAVERRHLGRLAKRFGGAGGSEPQQEAALRHHAQTFGFLLAPFNLGSPPSIASIKDRLADAALRDDVGSPLIDTRIDMLRDIPEPARELGLLAQELTYWKTERLDVMALGDSYVAPMYRAVAEALSISIEHLFAMRRLEIELSLTQGKLVVAESLLNERLKGYCLLLSDDEVEFFQPSRRGPTNHAVAESSTDIDTSEIRGTPSSPGVASGRVRIINDLADIQILESGDILVTSMTRPEMGVALDRAAAFVTDEGGRMCHAAIISREMRKPCVTGTGSATLMLRDGMHVLVDGTEGTVRITDHGNLVDGS